MNEQEFYQRCAIEAMGALIRNSNMDTLTFGGELNNRAEDIVSDAEEIAAKMRDHLRDLCAFDDE